MMYTVKAQDANLNEYLILSDISREDLDEFITNYCSKADDPWDDYYWLNDNELPECGLPYRSNGWIIRIE